MKKIVITGYGLQTPIGKDKESVLEHFINDISGVVYVNEWDNIPNFQTRFAGTVKQCDFSHIERKYRKTMGRVGLMACETVANAVDMAGVTKGMLSSHRTGLSYGSTMGSLRSLYDFYDQIISGSVGDISSTAFLKVMSHTCAANIAQMFQIKGRVIAPCSACVASSQAIGFAYEALQAGYADIMICGGAEELHFTSAGVFESLKATVIDQNGCPDKASRPFDADRSGLVVAEGAATLIIEEYEHALKRGATPLAEIAGFATNCDGTHLTTPTAEQMAKVMEIVLENSNIKPHEIDMINAHATATEKGDIAESKAVEMVFGSKIPVSSTKGYTGHMLGACGAAEALFSLFAIQENLLIGSKNLDKVDANCANLNYIQKTKKSPVKTVLSNNFAFGGLNTCLIIRGL